MATWTIPPLPRLGLVDGTDEQDDNALIEFSVEKGPSKTRKVISEPGSLAQFATQPMSLATRNALLAFFRTDCARGALTFLMDHPIDGTEMTWRFEGPPSIRLQGIHFMATLSLRIMP